MPKDRPAPPESDLSIPASLLSDILNQVPAAVYVKDAQGRYLYVNRTMCEWSNVKDASLFRGLTDFDLLPRPVADKCALSDKAVWDKEGPIELEEVIPSPSTGRLEPFLTRKFKLYDRDAAAYAIAGLSTPIGQLRKVEQEMAEAERRYRALFESTRDAILFTHFNGTILDCNPGAAALFRASRRDIVGRSILRFSTALQMDGRTARESLDAIASRLDETGHVNVEWMVQRRDGAHLCAEAAVTAVHLSGRKRLVIAVRDISERRRQLAELEYLANHDSLTGLPNRNRLIFELDNLTLDAGSRGHAFSLLLLDLDGFKDINDTLGHQSGDQLLTEIAARLQQCFGTRAGLVARLGGDEFAVILRHTDSAEAMRFAQELATQITTPLKLCDLVIQVGVSIGVVQFPDHGSDRSALMRVADIAMYTAKQHHLGIALYEPGLNTRSLGRLTLLAELSEAVRTDQLELHFQPLLRVSDKRHVGTEALLRWMHPSKGGLLPSEFIGLAEMNDTIHPLTYWVLERAMRTWAMWARAGRRESLAINLSARNVSDTTLVARIKELLKRYEVDPGCIVLELTESAILHDVGSAVRMFKALKDLGMSIAMDDFGAGYTALSQLSQLPIDKLKIDRCFISRIVDNNHDLHIVTSIIELSHKLKLTTVAEGVENERTFKLLNEIGCDVAQGYWCGMPAPAVTGVDISNPKLA